LAIFLVAHGGWQAGWAWKKMRANFIALLEQPSRIYGPKPGPKTQHVVMVLDNGPIRVSKAAKVAFAARAHWLTAEWVPKYGPELNDIEPIWHGIRAYNLANKTFSDAGTLDAANAVAADNLERNSDPLAKPRVSA
jgi:hypothetical protein